MWIVIASLGVLVTGAGVAFALLLKLGRLSAPAPETMALVQNLAIAVGVGVSLALLALLWRKVSRLGRFMGGGTSITGRRRRSRRLQQTRGMDLPPEEPQE